jgi:2-oxoglutarate dehydrogenase E2 component (dihydrolipoamide succinyltransferase)
MKHEVIVPTAGESITEVFIGDWRKKTGDLVKKDEVLVELETQKATFELQAEHSGRLEIFKPERDSVVKPGDVIAMIDDSISLKTIPAVGGQERTEKRLQEELRSPNAEATIQPILSPAARKMASEKNLDVSTLKGTGKEGRITKEDTLQAEPLKAPVKSPGLQEIPVFEIATERGERRQPASRIRRQIAQNLVAAQHTAAILTTFNDVDMSQVIEFRKKQKEAFEKKHGLPLSFITFFARASVRALKEFPIVNSSFTGEEIISRDFVDLSVAVSTDRGLVVPVVRDVDKLSVVDFEKRLSELTEKARAGKLSIPEMTGGTFTISNGGVFGSLLSTPILNMPQSAILGLHKTQDRPVVIQGKIEIRPMMYLALSYDHRLIDGREAVLFLVRIKEGIENLSLIIGEKDL